MGKEKNSRAGYQRAAAGVVSCLLIGGSLGAAALYPGTPSHAAAKRVPRIPEVSPSTVEWPSDEDADYLANVRKVRGRIPATKTVLEPIQYEVKHGDVLWGIAQKFDTDTQTLVDLNDIPSAHSLQPGQYLQVIPEFLGGVHTVKAGDTLDAIAQAYSVSMVAIQQVNGLTSDSILQVGARILLPRTQTKVREARGTLPDRGHVNRPADAPARPTPAPTPSPPPDPAPPPRQAGWLWPINGGRITSEFGPRWGSLHTGIDIGVAEGTPVVAARSGEVTFAGWHGGYGYCVVIDHGDGFQTRYAHASVILVSVGTWVEQGQTVIHVGNTGNSTGPHLHFEIILDGAPQNPRRYLP